MMPSREVCADAAAWLTSLQDSERTAEVEEGFRLWLAESPEHATAFEMATETWDRAARLTRRPAERTARFVSRPSLLLTTAAMAAVAGVAVLGTVYYFKSGAVSTEVGEQRTLTLEDGTRVFLNTGTRVAVHYDTHQRRVNLKDGEALFDVAKDMPGRPFVVMAGAHTVTALGTSFVVRNEAQQFSVTLVSGKVAVASETAARVVLSPGQRVTYAERRSPSVDVPEIDKITAWQHGQVAFDNTPLPEAVEEMNRYSAVKLVVAGDAAKKIHVSGVFRAGDSASFARAMAETYRLKWSHASRRFLLSGDPVMPRE